MKKVLIIAGAAIVLGCNSEPKQAYTQKNDSVIYVPGSYNESIPPEDMAHLKTLGWPPLIRYEESPAGIAAAQMEVFQRQVMSKLDSIIMLLKKEIAPVTTWETDPYAAERHYLDSIPLYSPIISDTMIYRYILDSIQFHKQDTILIGMN